METAFILGVVALSSAATMLLLRGRPHRRLGSAIGKALETVGLAAVFLFLNVGLGFCLALLTQVAGPSFVSLYVNDDVSIVVLSVLQALVLQWWREPENN
ncbi:MAG TPA: hypothetical protein VIC87_13755 [Vicinamibacteria bacterium]|jgi:hypothetical protein